MYAKSQSNPNGHLYDCHLYGRAKASYVVDSSWEPLVFVEVLSNIETRTFGKSSGLDFGSFGCSYYCYSYGRAVRR